MSIVAYFIMYHDLYDKNDYIFFFTLNNLKALGLYDETYRHDISMHVISLPYEN